MHFSRLVRAFALTAFLAAGSVYAAKICQSGNATLPGVDAQGNLDFGNTGPAIATVCINTKNNKIRAKAEGQVDNQSGATQRYGGAAFPDIAPFTKIKYRVKKSGAAKLTASGQGALP